MNERNRKGQFVRQPDERRIPSDPGSDDGNAALRAASPQLQVSMFSADGPIERNTSLESLWFQLTGPRFALTALVPIPDVAGTEADSFANDLARIGASISGAPVRMVSTLGVLPTDANAVAEALASIDNQPTLVSIESPTRNPAAIPILRACPRATLLVGLSRSFVPEIEQIVAQFGADRIVGAVCIERPTRSRMHRR